MILLWVYSVTKNSYGDVSGFYIFCLRMLALACDASIVAILLTIVLRALGAL